MSSRHLLDQIYYGTVASRLDFARALLDSHGPRLAAETELQQQISRLRQSAGSVADQMRAMELGPLCSSCATGPGGGCCSLFMAGETDSLQMLMNLLAGVEVQTARDDGLECVFLGTSGCIFLFKPMFCLNYTCTHIKTTATPAALHKLELLTGHLLSQQFKVEQRLLALLQYSTT